MIVGLFMIFTLGTTNALADSYAGRGAWIGALSGLGVGVVIGLVISQNCNDPENCAIEKVVDPALGAGFGAVGGTVIGLFIGSLTKKDPKISIAPLLMQSKSQGNTTGGSVEFRF